MAMNGTVDSSLIPNGQITKEHFLEGVKSPARVSRNGSLAFVVGIDGSLADGTLPMLSLETAVTRSGDAPEVGEVMVTAEQIAEKLAAAEARREAAMEELRNKCLEETSKIEKAREQRQQSVEELQETLKAKMEQAQANQEAVREALMDKLKKEEMRHEEVRSRKSEDFQELLRQLDSKYTDKDGKRNQVLTEIVDKVKEHNEKVKMIHDTISIQKQQNNSDSPSNGTDNSNGVSNGNSIGNSIGNGNGNGNAELDEMKLRYVTATGQREDYFNSAEARLQQENLQLETDGVNFSSSGMKRE